MPCKQQFCEFQTQQQYFQPFDSQPNKIPDWLTVVVAGFWAEVGTADHTRHCSSIIIILLGDRFFSPTRMVRTFQMSFLGSSVKEIQELELADKGQEVLPSSRCHTTGISIECTVHYYRHSMVSSCCGSCMTDNKT
jgi:hypothetical protein